MFAKVSAYLVSVSKMKRVHMIGAGPIMHSMHMHTGKSAY